MISQTVVVVFFLSIIVFITFVGVPDQTREPFILGSTNNANKMGIANIQFLSSYQEDYEIFNTSKSNYIDQRDQLFGVMTLALNSFSKFHPKYPHNLVYTVSLSYFVALCWL